MKQRNVLICDDSIFLRKIVSKFLSENGCGKIMEASDGVEAVEMYEKYKPAIVFMDVVMPNKNGIEALIEIKKINPEAKVIMLSSIGTKSNIKAAIDAGAMDFVQKPVTEEIVTHMINRWMTSVAVKTDSSVESKSKQRTKKRISEKENLDSANSTEQKEQEKENIRKKLKSKNKEEN